MLYARYVGRIMRDPTILLTLVHLLPVVVWNYMQGGIIRTSFHFLLPQTAFTILPVNSPSLML